MTDQTYHNALRWITLLSMSGALVALIIALIRELVK